MATKLREITKRLTASRKDNLAWHLQALDDLVPIYSDWRRWQKEAGTTFEVWRRSWRGPTKKMLSNFERARSLWDRVEDKLGPIATYLGDAGALIWIRRVSQGQAPGAKQALVKAWASVKKETGCGAPLPPRTVSKVIGVPKRRRRECQQCVTYRARIEELEAALAVRQAAE